MRFVRVSEIPGSRARRRAEIGLDAEVTAPTPLTTTRACPECATDMVHMRVDDRRVDYCPRCQGMWLERDAARNLVRRSFATWHPSNTGHDDIPAPVAAQLRLVPSSEAS
ncbi:MAG: zf-TFIIB domain-containing protein [Acidimicrobiia bacterium]